MSDPSVRAEAFEAGLAGQVLEAVERPALVCDAEATVRAANDALLDRIEDEAPITDAPVTSLVEFDGDPLARALDAGVETSGTATVAVEGGAVPCRVTARPLERERVVGAAVTLDFDDDAAWSLYRGSVAADGEYVYAVDADGTVRRVGENFERATGVPAEAVTGAPVEALAERGVLDDGAVSRLSDRLDALVGADRDRMRFNVHEETDDGERVIEHQLTAVRHDGAVEGAVCVAREVTERVRTTQALRESRNRLSTIVENLPVIMFVVNDEGVIEHYQGSGLDAIEYDREELLGAHLRDFAEDFPEVVDSTERALAGEKLERAVSIGGRHFKCFFEPLDDAADPSAMIGTAVDITERTERADELAATNRRLDLALRNTDAGVFEWTVGEDRVHWHDSLSELLGYDTDVSYRPKDAFRDLIHPDDVEKHRAAFERALEDGEFAVECRIFHPEKGLRWFRIEGEVEYEDGDPVRIVGIDRDITERKRREQALERTSERLDLALEGTDAGVFDWDMVEDTVYWHEATSELFGLDSGETYRDRAAFREHVHPDHEGEVLAAVEEAIESDGHVDVEYRIVRPDGEVRWLVTEGDITFADGDPVRLVGIVRDITERKERQREIERREEKLRAVVDSSPDPIMLKDTEGRFQVVNDAALEFADIPREEYLGRTPTELFGESDGRTVREHTETVLRTGAPQTVEETFETAKGERTFLATRAPYYGPDGEIQGVVTLSRDVTERKRQQDQLERLARIQELIHESIGAMAAADTEAEIKTTVCERLADSPFYEFAWVGERDPSSHAVEPACWAGDGADYLEDIAVTVDPGASGQGPIGRAYRSGEVAVVQDVAEDPEFEPWRRAALARDFASVTAVPLTHGSTTHGVLAVYADRSGAFSDRELAAFQTLGETVGFALSAVQSRRLLESETVLELEFLVRDPDSVTLAVADEADCRFVVDGAVGTGDGKTLCYLTVEDGDPEAGAHAAERADNIERATRLDGADGPDFELLVADSTYQILADAGARGTKLVIENGVGRVFAEAPADVDVRRVRDALETAHPEVELIARRETEPTGASWLPGHGDVGARLTERQRSVLRAAYYSGYYEWPRETDAEGLADSLGVATSTTLQHLRKGHHRVMRALFDS